jgi:hypothetical protein
VKESISRSIELSDNHRRSISIVLQLVDKALCQWDDWARGEVPSGVMYQQHDTLSPAQKHELSSKIARVRQLIIRLRDDLQLEPCLATTPQLIIGQATVLWEMLADLDSRSLRGYGEVPEDLAHYLDPLGEKLTTQMNAIAGMFSQPTAKRLNDPGGT